MFSGVAMQRLDIRTQRGDSHLWLTALGLSLLANTALVATVGFVTMKSLNGVRPRGFTLSGVVSAFMRRAGILGS